MICGGQEGIQDAPDFERDGLQVHVIVDCSPNPNPNPGF
jgi:hypothetical protein